MLHLTRKVSLFEVMQCVCDIIGALLSSRFVICIDIDIVSFDFMNIRRMLRKLVGIENIVCGEVGNVKFLLKVKSHSQGAFVGSCSFLGCPLMYV
ncbi:hypothetical protein RRG08_032094 [Elysia crispata]|uniref:Uncharacterized protein n=1 Tax=Elysia crispata TaxID=231223 RepID=A0AAE0ZDH2_9GAST|nr:hypothetical protein RRG08_032094 [Elysia crispata]